VVVVEMAESTVEARDLWQAALERLRHEGQTYVVSQLLQLHPLRFAEHVLTLGVEDLFFRDWVDDHYSELMGTALATVHSAPVLVKWEKVEKQQRADVPALPPAPVASMRRPARLNERFTFETYVVSDSNQLPAAAAYAVSESPGRAYNPLFIYGGTGLGKTHLLHAIGNRIISRNQGARVMYLSSEEFTNQFIESVRDQKMTEFRRRFREECDVLLIDDIHLGKKQETQNEFFYTFNALHQMSKAVVMTSDTVPSEIPGLEDRLRSRFAMGLITDVHEPTFEARMAILKKKAAAEGVNLTDKVTQFIARHVVKNVRELEGALIKVTAVHALTGQPLTEELCAQVLADLIPAQKALDAEAIQREVARYFKLPVEELRGERRVKHVAHARQVAMYLCRTLTAASLPEIGKRFNKDHSTVLTSVRKIETLKDTDDQLKLELGELSQKLATV
jgi:chromosomal replication initiator protein